MRRSFVFVAVASVVALTYTDGAHAQCELSPLSPASSATNDLAGRSVAISGDVAVVGAPEAELFSIAGAGPGHVTVYRRSGSAWLEEATLVANDASFQSGFGKAVAIDGDVIAVGALNQDDGTGFAPGAVYVFTRIGTTWQQQQKLLASPTQILGRFGWSIALQGDRMVVGTFDDEVVTLGVPGFAYVFERTGGAWRFVQRLTPSDGANFDRFGWSVALDGARILVGAPKHAVSGSAARGQAYVFEFGGATWSETAKLVDPLGQAFDYFGASVAVSGAVAAVGATSVDAIGFAPGSVHVFRDNSSTWAHEDELGLGSAVADGFGFACALAAETLLVGAPMSVAAPASLFRHSGGAWIQEPPLGPAAAATNGMGTSVAFDADIALVGAPFETNAGFAKAGSAHVFGIADSQQSLLATPAQLSASSGGSQAFDLHAGPCFAGAAYVLGGSASGTSPGLAVGAVVIPLNPDAYFYLSVLAPAGVLTSSAGVLDTHGHATASFHLPAGLPLAGLTLHHAFVAIELGTSQVVFASVPASVAITP